ncbi:MAG: hypothetical protein KDA33_11120, partial [Phycisphaerales bacterium]|nr:hypothetical protein [Phycisphaerales bacterium]
MTDHPEYRRGGVTRCVVALCLAWAGRGLAETHPATWVPSQSAAFIVAPNLAKSVGKFDAFLREMKPGFPGFDLAEFEMTAGFAPGVMDLSKPVMIIADRPEELMRLFSGAGLSEGDATWPVIGFTPADAGAFQKMLRDDHNGQAQSIVGAFGRYRVVLRDGVAFVAAKRSALSKIATLDADGAAYARMSDAARDDATSADIYMQFSMGAWRPLYESKLRAVVELMKLGFRAQPGDAARAEQVRKLSDWFFSSALDGVQQMDSVAVGLSFDGERFRLAHHHSFRQNDWMADYLGKVSRREDVTHWRAFPDESFLFALSSNWNVPSESCFAVRFNRRCMNDPALCRNLTRQQRLELDQNIATLTNATSVEEFILTSPPGRLAPFQMRGAYLAKDAGRILGVMQKVRAHSQEIVGSIIPGAAELAGKTHLTKMDGMDVYQIRLADASESPMVR